MNHEKKIKLVIVVAIVAAVLITSFNSRYNFLLSDFEDTARIKVQLLQEHIQVSSDFIKGVALHGTILFEQKSIAESELYPLLKYDPAQGGYNMDSVRGTEYEKLAGNLTGIGNVPANGVDRDEVNLALQFNRFFSSYFERFPDVAWLYYTSENNFINMYPWIAAKDFSFSAKLKTIPFYTVANPQNNPLRKSVWTPVYLDEAGKGLMVTLSAPVYDKDTFKGVVSLDLTNQWLSSILETGYEGFLIDNKDTVIANNISNAADQAIIKLEDFLNIPHITQYEIETLKTLENGAVIRFKDYYIYSASFDNADWRLFFRVPVWLVAGKAALTTLPILFICLLLLWLLQQVELRRRSEETLQKEKELFETTLYSINEGIVVTDQAGKVTLLNPTAEKYTGWPNNEAAGQIFTKVVNYMNLLTGEKGPDPVKLALETGKSNQSEQHFGILSKDGSETYVLGGTAPILSAEGKITGAVTSFRDITKEYEQEKQIEGFINLNLDMLCITDKDGIVQRVNNKFMEVVGYTKEELEGQSLLSFMHKEDIPAAQTALKEIAEKNIPSFTNRFYCRDGSYKYIEWMTQPSFGKYIYSSARDVTEKVRRTEMLETLAVKDQLTGLYNRHFMDMIIVREMEISDRNNLPLSMVILDLDLFKNVNDQWGHPVGDELLKQTAQIARDIIRTTDIGVRFGGEEFVIIMPQTSINGALAAAEKIRLAIEQKNHPITGRQTASFGAAERMRGETFDGWYRRVDEALYRAKQSGRNRVIEAYRSN